MKVFFDARMITHPGIGRYIRNITLRLVRDNRLHLTLLGDRRVIANSLSGRYEVLDFDYPIYSIAEQIGFQRIRKKIGDSILHVPHYNVPFWGDHRLVATVHDLIHMQYPSGARSRFAAAYMQFAVSRLLRRARAVICVSAATKTALQESFKTTAARYAVIPEAPDERFSAIPDMTAIGAIEKKFSLPATFILYVGSLRKHKNIDMLIAAYRQVRKKIPGVCLVLAGKRSQDIDVAAEGVRYLGEVEDAELAALYNRASVFCQLSLYEGFSLTVLEAQRSGLPVVCSDIAPHREITAHSALLVAPDSVDRITEALYNVLTDKDAQRSFIQKGLENAQRFNWNLAAQQTFEIYQRISDH